MFTRIKLLRNPPNGISDFTVRVTFDYYCTKDVWPNEENYLDNPIRKKN